jgi:ribosomal-protein-serine acetyltransferase
MKYGANALHVDADLTLVPRHPNDSAETFALVDAHRAPLNEWLTWVETTYTVGDIRRYAQFAESQFERHIAFDYAIRWQGAMAGGIGLHNMDFGSRNAHIGYWLAPTFQGRGIMTRAAEALTTHAFSALALHRLEIRCVIENLKSRAVAERLGYHHEGELREAYLLHGRFRDIALYAMTATEWRARS